MVQNQQTAPPTPANQSLEGAVPAAPATLDAEAFQSLLTLGQEYVEVQKQKILAQREEARMDFELEKMNSQRNHEYRMATLQRDAESERAFLARHRERETKLLTAGGVFSLLIFAVIFWALYVGAQSVALGFVGVLTAIVTAAGILFAYSQGQRSKEKKTPQLENDPAEEG